MAAQADAQGRVRSAEEIRAWLVLAVAGELEVDPETIDPERPLTRYGLDSLTAVVIAGELEEWLERPIPPGLLAARPTIDAISSSLAEEAQTLAPVAEARDYEHWTRGQAALRWIVRGLVRVLMRVDASGTEQIPPKGPFIVVANHLHVFDAPLVFALLPTRVVFLAADKFSRVPVVNWFLRTAGDAIYVARGESDRASVLRAVQVLRSGGRLALAPEGRVSRPGMIEGQTGAAYMARQARVPVVPVAIYGHERPFSHWLRLRRVPVTMRVGTPIPPSSAEINRNTLANETEQLMLALARMLPPENRGVYAERV